VRRIVWLLVLERDDDEHVERRGIARWAIIGLAVLGVSAVIVWRVLMR
jgi:hypothetical protein